MCHLDFSKRKKKSTLHRRRLPKPPPGVGNEMEDDFYPEGPLQPRPDPVGRSYSPDIREEGGNYNRVPPSRLAPLTKTTQKKHPKRSSVMFEDDDDDDF